VISGTRSKLGPKDSKDLSRVSFVVSAGRPTLKASRSRNFQHSFAPVSLIARVSRFACHVVCPLSSFLKILSCFFVNVLSERPSKTRCRGSERWWTCPENFQFVGRHLEGEISSDQEEGTNISAQTYTQLPCPKAHRGQEKTFHRFIAGIDSAAVQCEAKIVRRCGRLSDRLGCFCSLFSLRLSFRYWYLCSVQ
jgi:hypothetical protein